MGTLMTERDHMQREGTGAVPRRRSRARREDPILWDEMTPHQRWIVEAGRATPRVQVPDTIRTAEEYVDWQMARLAELKSRDR
ncbi:MAG TPA: hypothetical protein VME47_16960 [Acetobacteraceae bacterium]|nr:hypothetical protein [Acetobacteraceae bacterium]